MQRGGIGKDRCDEDRFAHAAWWSGGARAHRRARRLWQRRRVVGHDGGGSDHGRVGAAGQHADDRRRGGTVEARRPYAGTNNDQSQWIALAGRMTLCRFVADDGSRIDVDVDSLAAEEASLAAAAYLAKVPVPDANAANPAVVDCTELNGTSAFGSASASGGGWVNLDDPDFTVVNLCVFADGSGIDEWGIAYYSDGAIRGADLAPLFRFDTADVAALFPPQADVPTRTTAP